MSDEVTLIRTAIASLTPAPSHDATQPPELTQIYPPEGHEAALDPERPLVIGGRGTGKSFWSATLLNPVTREFIASSYPRLQLERCDVSLGFAGVDADINGAPSREELDDLIEKDRWLADKVWRAVILKGVSRVCELNIPSQLRGSDGLVAWVEEDAGRAQMELRRADDILSGRGARLIIVFDALDRLGVDWQQIRQRTKALLQVALAMRSYRAIKPKIFMRVDQAEDRGVAAFPDASKMLSPGARVDLDWERRDLYGLLYTLLANDADAGDVFVNVVENTTGFRLEKGKTFLLPTELKDIELKQEAIFAALAGRYMGANKKQGRTYTWLHNHLADSYGRVSPRSFLEALRNAAIYRGVSDSRLAVVPKGLQAGIQGASEQRLKQLQEEYGWIDTVIEPLADLNVPCQGSDLFELWEKAQTVEAIHTPAGGEPDYLEPIELYDATDDKKTALLKALIRIGVAERRSDGRINIPDIYRVAAKLRRRGGVKPRRAKNS